MERANNGQGSVDKQDRGLYRIAIRYGTVRKQFYGKTLREARAKQRAYEKDAGTAQSAPAAPSGTVGALLDEWYTHRTVMKDLQQTSASTLARYEGLIRHNIKPQIGDQVLTQVTPKAIDLMLAKLAKDGLSTSSIRQCRSALSQAFDFAVVEGRLDRNPVTSVSLPRGLKPVKEADPLTLEELRTLLNVLATEEHGPIFAFIALTGVRMSEATGLRWRDLDLENAEFHLSTQAQKVGGVWQFVPLKTRAVRTLALSPLAVQFLVRQRDVLRERAQWPGYVERDLVFPNRRGNPYEPQNVTNRMFRKMLDRAGLRKVRVHDLRHTHGTLLASAGTPLPLIQHRLGHTTANFTASRYIHPTTQGERTVANQIDLLVQDSVA